MRDVSVEKGRHKQTLIRSLVPSAKTESVRHGTRLTLSEILPKLIDNRANMNLFFEVVWLNIYET